MYLMQTLRETLALRLIPLIGDITARKLIEVFGTAGQVLKLSKKELMNQPGVPEGLASRIVKNSEMALRAADEELEFCESKGVQILHFYDSNYPHRLAQCVDAPLVLFMLGNRIPDHKKILSVVGTRKASDYGYGAVKKILSDFDSDEVMVVSGLAYGIDTSAHKMALDNDLPTIAVLGHGFKTIYPSENRKLAERILENGALITEFLSYTFPDRDNFPARNRIIAGLSDATLVVQAREKGGALITAEMALSYNRDVFAVPGRIEDDRSHGCHWLIKTNRAALIENADDLRQSMSWSRKKTVPAQIRMNIVMNPLSESIFNLIQEKEDCSIDYICNTLEMHLNSVAMTLLELEFQGLIIALPGKRYKLA